jgi:hypothetical protein
MDDAWFPANSERPKRATLRLIEPALQLRLPLYLGGITIVFALLALLHSWLAYSQLLSVALPDASEGYRGLLGEQTGAFLWLSFLLLMAYGLVVLAVCIAYLRGLMGPIVAFRRQIDQLRRGDYSARNSLRRDAPFEDLGKDLNELARALEVRREMKLLNH